MTSIVSLSLFFWVLSVVRASTKLSEFSRNELCDVDARMKNGCMKKIGTGENRLQCAVWCLIDDTCSGFSVSITSKDCYMHTACPAVSGCAVKDSDQELFLNPSAMPPKPLPCTRGTWDEPSRKCICPTQYSGDLCERRAYNCKEFVAYHPNAVGKNPVLVQPPGYTTPLKLKCAITDNSIRTYFLQNSGELDFSRPWADYVNGFFIERHTWSSSYWIGLNNMYYFLNQAPVKDLGLKTVYTNRIKEHKYSNPILGDSNTNYILQFSPFSTPGWTNPATGDYLLPSNMTSFSTPDAIHEGNIQGQCLDEAGTGWWYPNCDLSSNPMGKFYNSTPPLTPDKSYITLPGITPEDIQQHLVSAEMFMIEY